jgi:DNA-binding IscR family transcriptional regulator
LADKSLAALRALCFLAAEAVGMLSMKSKYALKALGDLARLPAGQVAASVDMATRHGISKKFLDSILAELRLAGFVTTRKGRT